MDMISAQKRMTTTRAEICCVQTSRIHDLLTIFRILSYRSPKRPRLNCTAQTNPTNINSVYARSLLVANTVTQSCFSITTNLTPSTRNPRTILGPQRRHLRPPSRARLGTLPLLLTPPLLQKPPLTSSHHTPRPLSLPIILPSTLRSKSSNPSELFQQACPPPSKSSRSSKPKPGKFDRVRSHPLRHPSLLRFQPLLQRSRME